MSAEVIRRHTYGEVHAPQVAAGFIGVARRSPGGNRAAIQDCVAVIDSAKGFDGWNLRGYGAVLTDGSSEQLGGSYVGGVDTPAIVKAEHLEHISDGDILALDFRKGYVRSLYRIGSSFNTIFATDQCNSNCLMCSQPPKDVDDSAVVRDHLRLISLIPATTESLGITGGEPTLLGDGLFAVLSACKDRLPVTRLHMLTNGRTFAHRPMVKKLAAIQHPNLSLGIPLYSDVASHHDYVVQATGAFDQTMLGFHNLATYGVRIEIRVVLHGQTYKRLPKLAQFIYRNVPFAEHIALMGLEMMGYTKTNLKALWVDPVDYQEQLLEAVEYLSSAGMNVSIYNHQLCVLHRALWRYARKSISDFKNLYLNECADCAVLDRCGGLFKSAEHIHSAHIRPFSAVP